MMKLLFWKIWIPICIAMSLAFLIDAIRHDRKKHAGTPTKWAALKLVEAEAETNKQAPFNWIGQQFSSTTYIGIYLSYRDERTNKTVPFKPEFELLSGKLPCGNKYRVFYGMEWPTNDVPCPCGNTNHWLWKFDYPKEAR